MKQALAAASQQVWTGLRLDKLFPHKVPRGERVTLDRRRIYALPTRYGLLFALMLLVMLLGSINYNNSLGFVLTFLLAGLGLLSILYTYRNIARLSLGRGRALPAFAGGTARFIVQVHNADRLPRIAIALAPKNAEAVLCDIPAQDTAQVELNLPARKRGRLALGRLTVSTVFPLGLVRAWSYADVEMQCLVYPQPGPIRPLPRERRQDAGEHSGQQAGPDDFLGFRVYQAGDSIRHVHWKALARALPLLTKQFAASESPELWLDWDALPQLDSEARLRQLCRWVLEAERDGRGYGLRLPGTVIEPNQGEGHRQRCLEALALYEEARR